LLALRDRAIGLLELPADVLHELAELLGAGFHERLVDERPRLIDLAIECPGQLVTRAALRRKSRRQQAGDTREPGLLAARDVELRQALLLESHAVVRQLLARERIPGERVGGGLSLARVDRSDGQRKVDREPGVPSDPRQIDVLDVRRAQLRAMESVGRVGARLALPL